MRFCFPGDSVDKTFLSLRRCWVCNSLSYVGQGNCLNRRCRLYNADFFDWFNPQKRKKTNKGVKRTQWWSNVKAYHRMRDEEAAHHQEPQVEQELGHQDLWRIENEQVAAALAADFAATTHPAPPAFPPLPPPLSPLLEAPSEVIDLEFSECLVFGTS